MAGGGKFQPHPPPPLIVEMLTDKIFTVLAGTRLRCLVVSMHCLHKCTSVGNNLIKLKEIEKGKGPRSSIKLEIKSSCLVPMTTHISFQTFQCPIGM